MWQVALIRIECHLAHLGVMRRLLLLWIRGPLTVRWPARIVFDLSSFLLSLSAHIPTEFCRRPRALAEIDRWKATEFRLFLLYCGPVVLKTFLKDPLYKHFLLLFAASTILSHDSLSRQFHDYAGSLLSSFVHGVVELYGKSELVYNVHCLLHIVDDVTRYGCLDSYSSYPFENKLKDIKRLVRKPSLPLQQAVHRLIERNRQLTDSSHNRSRHANAHYSFQREHIDGPLPDGVKYTKQFFKLFVSEVLLSVNQRDRCVQLLDKSIVVVRNILQHSDKAMIVYNKFNIVRDFFDYPLPSSALGIFEVSCLGHSLYFCDAGCIYCKCVLLPATAFDESSYVVLPLLHTGALE